MSYQQIQQHQQNNHHSPQLPPPSTAAPNSTSDATATATAAAAAAAATKQQITHLTSLLATRDDENFTLQALLLTIQAETELASSQKVKALESCVGDLTEEVNRQKRERERLMREGAKRTREVKALQATASEKNGNNHNGASMSKQGASSNGSDSRGMPMIFDLSQQSQSPFTHLPSAPPSSSTSSMSLVSSTAPPSSAININASTKPFPPDSTPPPALPPTTTLKLLIAPPPDPESLLNLRSTPSNIIENSTLNSMKILTDLLDVITSPYPPNSSNNHSASQSRSNSKYSQYKLSSFSSFSPQKSTSRDSNPKVDKSGSRNEPISLDYAVSKGKGKDNDKIPSPIRKIRTTGKSVDTNTSKNAKASTSLSSSLSSSLRGGGGGGGGGGMKDDRSRRSPINFDDRIHVNPDDDKTSNYTNSSTVSIAEYMNSSSYLTLKQKITNLQTTCSGADMDINLYELTKFTIEVLTLDALSRPRPLSHAHTHAHTRNVNGSDERFDVNMSARAIHSCNVCANVLSYVVQLACEFGSNGSLRNTVGLVCGFLGGGDDCDGFTSDIFVNVRSFMTVTSSGDRDSDRDGDRDREDGDNADYDSDETIDNNKSAKKRKKRNTSYPLTVNGAQHSTKLSLAIADSANLAAATTATTATTALPGSSSSSSKKRKSSESKPRNLPPLQASSSSLSKKLTSHDLDGEGDGEGKGEGIFGLISTLIHLLVSASSANLSSKSRQTTYSLIPIQHSVLALLKNLDFCYHSLKGRGATGGLISHTTVRSTYNFETLLDYLSTCDVDRLAIDGIKLVRDVILEYTHTCSVKSERKREVLSVAPKALSVAGKVLSKLMFDGSGRKKRTEIESFASAVKVELLTGLVSLISLALPSEFHNSKRREREREREKGDDERSVLLLLDVYSVITGAEASSSSSSSTNRQSNHERIIITSLVTSLSSPNLPNAARFPIIACLLRIRNLTKYLFDYYTGVLERESREKERSGDKDKGRKGIGVGAMVGLLDDDDDDDDDYRGDDDEDDGRDELMELEKEVNASETEAEATEAAAARSSGKDVTKKSTNEKLRSVKAFSSTLKDIGIFEKLNCHLDILGLEVEWVARFGFDNIYEFDRDEKEEEE